MPYNSAVQFPRGVSHTDAIDSDGVILFSEAVHVVSIHVSTSLASVTLDFTSADGTTQYLRVKATISQNAIVPISFFAADGLQAVVSGFGTADVTVNYVLP